MINLAKLQPQTFNWRITTPDPLDATNQIPVDDCQNVRATLYGGRSQSNPDQIPGYLIPEFENLGLTHTTDGNYEVQLDATFNPMASSNYVLVIDADRDAEAFAHWEEPCTVYVNS